MPDQTLAFEVGPLDPQTNSKLVTYKFTRAGGPHAYMLRHDTLDGPGGNVTNTQTRSFYVSGPGNKEGTTDFNVQPGTSYRGYIFIDANPGGAMDSSTPLSNIVEYTA